MCDPFSQQLQETTADHEHTVVHISATQFYTFLGYHCSLDYYKQKIKMNRKN